MRGWKNMDRTERACRRFAGARRVGLLATMALLSILVFTAEAPAADNPLLTGVAGTLTAAVICGEGTLYFSNEIQQRWFVATGTDPALFYTAVLPGTDSGFLVSAEDGSVWASNTPQGSGFFRRAQAAGQPLRALAKIGSRIVAVGDGGTIVRSTGLSGTNWTAETSPVQANLRGVAGNGVTSVAVGDGGTILKGGSEGNDWFEVVISESADFRAVVVDPNGKYLALGQDGVMWQANPDGVTWSRVDSGISVNLRAATQVGLRTVAVGDDGNIFYSNGGFSDWQIAATPIGLISDLYAVSFTGSSVLAAGERNVALWSEFGVSWIYGPTATVEMTWGRLKQQYSGEAQE